MKTTGLIYAGILSMFLIACDHRESSTIDYDPGISDDYSSITDIHHYRQWGVYNVHDPSIIKDGGNYYLYSTDAIYWPPDAIRESDTIEVGNIHVRRSTDLVQWEFLGWAFDGIPEDAIEHIKAVSGGQEPVNVWAPYVMKFNDEFRIFYSVSLFGANTSYIGLATSDSPEGPWVQRGAVVKTSGEDPMNAIDASVVVDLESGRHWMHYGSYFDGLYCLELDPETGLALNEDDKGHAVARRAEGKTRIIEAPEIIFNPELNEYFLFVSYEPLFTHYNVRVGRSNNPEGPFFDYFGNDLADTTNNYPVITHAYRFENHAGWAGVAHCAVMNDNGRYFMFHQGRLAPDNLQMVLHVREIFWTSDGWPVVSPQRYAGVPKRSIRERDILGVWEHIQLADVNDTVTLWQGQIPFGGWHYSENMFNNSERIEFKRDGTIENREGLKWELAGQYLKIIDNGSTIELIVTNGWDWENGKETVVYTGIAENGYSIWGKKVD